MSRKIDRVCEECGDISNAWKGGFKQGHFLCRYCIHRNKFPNLFKKIYGEIKFKKKDWKKKRRYRFKKEEQYVLFKKHEKDMTEAEYKSHLNKMRGIVSIVKSLARKKKREEKPDFKTSFAELTKRKKVEE